MKRIGSELIIFCTLAIVLSGCIALLFFPDNRQYVQKEQLLIQPEDVTFASETPNVWLHGWYFSQIRSKAKSNDYIFSWECSKS